MFKLTFRHRDATFSRLFHYIAYIVPPITIRPQVAVHFLSTMQDKIYLILKEPSMRGSSLIFRSVQRFDILAVMQKNYCAGVKANVSCCKNKAITYFCMNHFFLSECIKGCLKPQHSPSSMMAMMTPLPV